MEKVCKICGWHLYKQINDCCVAIGVPEIAPVQEEDEVILEEEEVLEEVVEEEESDDDNEDLEAYLEALPVKELKKLCEEADLSKKGKKADLVARLLE
tara:strand:- start:71 stop:364 length:294 start_codon:yes stop_codon:yes gene_type:complete